MLGGGGDGREGRVVVGAAYFSTGHEQIQYKRVCYFKPMLGAWPVLHISVLVMNTIHKTESAIVT